MWDSILLKPILNVLIVFYSWLFDNFGLAIIALTILIRLVTLPLTLRQLRASKAMTSLQPRIQELQKKYAKDKQRLSQEMMRLYREAGVSPLGCLLPMLIQLPIWIALYQSIMQVLGNSANLDKYLYSWSIVREALPVSPHFLWLDLSSTDRYFLLPIIVAGSTWIQQKMTTLPAADPKQQSMSSMMLYMMPVMLGLFALQFPSGLALYWMMSNVVGIIIQYFVTGWGGLEPFFRARRAVSKANLSEKITTSKKEGEKQEKGLDYGKHRGKRKDRRGSDSTGSGTTEDKS